jgi:hypothetical protein
MADRGNDDRPIRPLPVFNGTMTGPSMKGDDGDSYAVWRARLVINLLACEAPTLHRYWYRR